VIEKGCKTGEDAAARHEAQAMLGGAQSSPLPCHCKRSSSERQLGAHTEA
jgi:hypothetical protein